MPTACTYIATSLPTISRVQIPIYCPASRLLSGYSICGQEGTPLSATTSEHRPRVTFQNVFPWSSGSKDGGRGNGSICYTLILLCIVSIASRNIVEACSLHRKPTSQSKGHDGVTIPLLLQFHSILVFTALLRCIQVKYGRSRLEHMSGSGTPNQKGYIHHQADNHAQDRKNTTPGCQQSDTPRLGWVGINMTDRQMPAGDEMEMDRCHVFCDHFDPSRWRYLSEGREGTTLLLSGRQACSSKWLSNAPKMRSRRDLLDG